MLLCLDPQKRGRVLTAPGWVHHNRMLMVFLEGPYAFPHVQPSSLPHDGHVTRRRFSSSAFFANPARIISHAAPVASAMKSSRCGSIATLFLPARMWMRLEIQLPTPPIGYVGVELGRR